MAELEESGLSHGLLDDDVEDLAHCLAVSSVRAVDVLGVDDVLALFVDFQVDLLAHEHGLDQVAFFFKSLSGPNVETRVDVLANQKLDLSVVHVNNLGKLERCDWRSILGVSFLFTDLNYADRVLEDLGSILTDGHLELVGHELLLLDFSFLWVDRHGNE